MWSYLLRIVRCEYAVGGTVVDRTPVFKSEQIKQTLIALNLGNAGTFEND